MGFRQFLLRGHEAVTGEWALVSIAWNLKRMFALNGQNGVKEQLKLTFLRLNSGDDLIAVVRKINFDHLLGYSTIIGL